MPLYQRLLGDAFDTLPEPVRSLHTVTDSAHYAGRCFSQRGPHLIARLIATVLRLPPDGQDQPLQVAFRVYKDGEIWTRHFGSHRFVSTQWMKHGLMYERIFCITLVFAVTGNTDGLNLFLKNIKFCGLPIQWLVRARVKAMETMQDGRFHLSIDTHLPLIGQLVRYDGWLDKV